MNDVKGKGHTHIVFSMGDTIRISPPIWPDHTLEVNPGDLSQYAPNGNGVYGYQEKSWDPLKGGPSQDACGGVIYFDGNPKKEEFEALLKLLEVGVNETKFAAFIKESENPGNDGYLTQLRTVPDFALRFMYGTKEEDVPTQKMTVLEAFWQFIRTEHGRWGTQFGSAQLDGKFGGDGDFAQEKLSFGFMLENGYNSICRIWSRAWLVTK